MKSGAPTILPSVQVVSKCSTCDKRCPFRNDPNLGTMLDYRRVVTIAVDLLALLVALIVGVLSMPVGAILGSLMVGGKVFTTIWKALGNSRNDFNKMLDDERRKRYSSRQAEGGNKQEGHP